MENLNTLINLTKINSYSTNIRSCNIKLDYINSLLSDLPLITKRHTSETFGDLMVLTTKENDPKKPNICLVFHYDTVFQPDTNFPIKKEKQKLFGPGIYDMQGSIYVLIEILRDLNKNKQLSNITVVLNSCEEQGSPEFQKIVEKIAVKQNYVLTFEGSSEGSPKPKSKKFPRTFTLITSRKGIFMQKVSISGPGGHSGMIVDEEKRKNVITKATKVIQQIDALADYKNATTINIAHIRGGQINTIIADNLEFHFDVRFQFESERERVKNGIEEIIKTNTDEDYKIIDEGYLYDLPPLQPNSNTQKFFSMVKKLAKQDKIYIEEERRGGWSDVCNFYHYNPKIMALDGFGPKGADEHTTNEFLYIDSIKPSIDLSLLTIKKLLATKIAKSLS